MQDNRSELESAISQQLPGAMRLAVRLAGNVHDAEDIVGEALLRVARAADGFRGDASFKTWFWKVVINVFRSRLRSRRITEPLAGDVSVDMSPDQKMRDDEVHAKIGRHISALPRRQREVVVLVCVEEFSVDEAAEILEITAQNIHATLHVARARLRRELAEYAAFATSAREDR